MSILYVAVQFGNMESTTSEKNDNHNGELISIAIVFLFVSFVGLVCRMLSKRMKRASLVLDDFLLLLAFVRL